MAPEIAETLRQALMGVVMEGTAKRPRGAHHAPNETPLQVGGKTGTGNTRLDRFGRGEAAPVPIIEVLPTLTGLRKSSEGSAD